MIGSALLVGVADYQSVPSLPVAVRNDVQDVAALLLDPDISELKPDDLTMLTDGQATAAAIRAAFDALAQAPIDGAFLFYFSGHGERRELFGLQQSWLLAYDTDLSDLAATALSSNEIAGYLRAITADRQVIMIDACHAGGIAAMKGQVTTLPKGFGEAGAGALAGSGRAILTSSRDDERSIILSGARNSIFTSALLDAMKGKAIDRADGLIGILDVFTFVADSVPAVVDQHPMLHVDALSGNFPIIRRRLASNPYSEGDLDLIVELFVDLYPRGPMHDSLWARAGGNVAQLTLDGTGAAQWHSALTKVRNGGGGLTVAQLLKAAAKDYPNHPALRDIV
jgi:hypothetical protein